MSRRSRRIGAAVLLLAVVVGVVSAVPVGHVLVVEDADDGEAVLSIPVENGTPVALEYTHSVEKTRVLEAYAVDDGRLVATRMEFESYGWGLPSGAEVRTENGTFVFEPEGSYEELYVTPGDVARHRLHVADRSYDLYGLVGEESVRLRVQQRSALDIALATISA